MEVIIGFLIEVYAEGILAKMRVYIREVTLPSLPERCLVVMILA